MQHVRSGSARVVGPVASTAARGGALVVAMLLGLTVLLLGASPAQAHAELESSSPKAGATLSEPPEEISFTFGEDLLDTGNGITLTVAATGEPLPLPLADPTVEGDTISVPWPAAAPAGQFSAAYRVVSEDGHPVQGVVSFTVTKATGATSAFPSPSPTPSAAVVAPAPTGLPSAVASAPSHSQSSPGGAAPESQPEAGVLAWVLGIGVIALIGALAATWVTRRTRSE